MAYSADYLIVSALCILMAVYHGLSARIDITKVPWIRLYKNPETLGSNNYENGKRFRASFINYLLCFISISLLIVVALFFLSSAISSSILESYPGSLEFLKNHPKIEILIFLLRASFSLGVYNFWVHKAKGIVNNQSIYFPKKLLRKTENLDDIPQFSKEILEELKVTKPVGTKESSAIRDYTQTRSRFRIAFYMPPQLLAYPYTLLSKCTGNILAACCLLLINRYDIKTILDFWKYHKEIKMDSMSTQEIVRFLNENVINSSFSNNEYILAEAILNAKIRTIGFMSTESYILQYIPKRAEIFESKDEQRNNGRVPVNKQCKLVFGNPGLEISANIYEADAEGGGIYVSLSTVPNGVGEKNSLTVKFLNGDEVRGNIIHNKSRSIDGKEVSGLGIQICETDQTMVCDVVFA